MTPRGSHWPDVAKCGPGAACLRAVGGEEGTLLGSRHDFLSTFYPLWLPLTWAFLWVSETPPWNPRGSRSYRL